MTLQFCAFGLLALVFLGLAADELRQAHRMRRRTGHWHAHRIAGVLICVALGTFFGTLALA